MGRAKIPIKWIQKDASRNVTFIKRKRGLRKKVEELSILCGVEACMICFAPHTDQHSSQDHHPDVWPNLSKALEVIERYKRLSKEEQDKKKLDNSSFLEQRIRKLRCELNMRRKENKDLEMDILHSHWDAYLNDQRVENLRDLLEYIDVKLEAIQDRITFLTSQDHDISHPALRNEIIPCMDTNHTDRKPLGEPYLPSPSQIMLHNLFLSMPYQTQDSLGLGLAAGHAKPHLALEEQCYKNHFGTAPIEYHAMGSPILLTPVKDSHHTADSLTLCSKYNTNKDKMETASTDDRQHGRIFLENSHVVTRKNCPLTSGLPVQSNACVLPNYSAQWASCCTMYGPCPEHYHMGSYGSQSATLQDLEPPAKSQHLERVIHGFMDGQNNHHREFAGEGIDLPESHSSPGASSSRIDEEFNTETWQDSGQLSRQRKRKAEDDQFTGPGLVYSKVFVME